MIKAYEARKKAEMVDRVKEKKKAEEKILEAVENGRFSCRLGFLASDDTIIWLEALGYRVTRVDPHAQIITTAVSW